MNAQQQALIERITINLGNNGSRPTVRGLRFPVGDILELMASGLSEEDIYAALFSSQCDIKLRKSFLGLC